MDHNQAKLLRRTNNMADSPIEVVIGVLVEAFIAATALGVVYRLWGRTLGIPQSNKVLPLQRGVLMREDQVQRVLEPGSHWVSPKSTIYLCDMRPKPFQVTGLEVLTADNCWLRISLKGETAISDPERYITASGDSRGTFYGDIRQGLHEFVARKSSEFITGDRDSFTSSFGVSLIKYAEPLGLNITRLEVWETMVLGWRQYPAEPNSETPLLQ
jgi:hypothetical protein